MCGSWQNPGKLKNTRWSEIYCLSTGHLMPNILREISWFSLTFRLFLKEEVGLLFFITLTLCQGKKVVFIFSNTIDMQEKKKTIRSPVTPPPQNKKKSMQVDNKQWIFPCFKPLDFISGLNNFNENSVIN